MTNKNNFKQRIVLVVVIAIVIIVLGAIYWSSMSGPAAAPTTSATSTTSIISTTTAQDNTSGTGIQMQLGTSYLPSSGAVTPTSTVWQQYLGKKNELIVSYPPGWTLGPNTPISMDNFEHAYAADGSIPIGGAEIDIATTTVYGSLDNLASSQLSSGTITGTSTISVSGVSCKEYFYNNTYAPNVPSKNIAVYCPQGGKVFEIYLSYRGGDPNGAQYVNTFGQVLSRIQFTGK